MQQLNGKVALVTGASSGIGQAIAQRFGQEGATVYLTGRRTRQLDAVAAEIGERATAVTADVSDPDDLDRVFDVISKRSGHLDIVVANAAVGTRTALSEITVDHFNRTFDINVKGLIFTVQKALPLLSESASVILMSSTVSTRGWPSGSVYAASKAAIRNLARSFAVDLAPRSIRVNAISPGPIETEALMSALCGDGTTRDAVRASMTARIPLGRLGRPDEVAAAALFLASDQSSFTTGSELIVDGGVSQT
ncbi:SDR family NAD(P)-dependent oxidoreductase [Streptomyces sp. NPDC050161]|uniref:SDR family NAD(P)-dependent oxidoreductase n=1 Tax=Streptomyces sp. NPDC050161 TaxID=3365604 RepID=UPI003797C82F